jgi:hypothetical protein
MKRRDFLISALAVAISVPGAARAMELRTIAYDDSDPISAALAEGRTVFVDFTTD